MISKNFSVSTHGRFAPLLLLKYGLHLLFPRIARLSFFTSMNAFNLVSTLPIETGAEPGKSFLLYRTSNAQPTHPLKRSFTIRILKRELLLCVRVGSFISNKEVILKGGPPIRIPKVGPYRDQVGRVPRVIAVYRV